MGKGNKKKIKIMVGSTVYGFEDQLSAIVALLKSMNYKVLNSHAGTIKVDSNLSNLENCLNAVNECDLFLGIIRPNYGSGNIGDKNITFEEIRRAIELKKPYWFLVHHDVDVIRRFLKKIMPKDTTKELTDVVDIKIDRNLDYRCIEVYDFVLQSAKPIESRIGNWVQEFYKPEEIMTFIHTQFSDKEFIEEILKMKETDNGK